MGTKPEVYEKETGIDSIIKTDAWTYINVWSYIGKGIGIREIVCGGHRFLGIWRQRAIENITSKVTAIPRVSIYLSPPIPLNLLPTGTAADT